MLQKCQRKKTKEIQMKRTKNQSELSYLAYKLIPILEREKTKNKQDYHYRYLVGTLRYILNNFNATHKENRYRRKHNGPRFN